MCLAACEATTNCAAVTYIGTACYFKKAFSSLITNPSASSAFMINTQNYPVPASGNSKASSGCGSALPAGIQLGGSSTTFNITSNGVIRSFNIHVPTSYKNNKAAPLIVAYHGRSNNQLSVESDSQLSSETWNPYAISVYPLGINVSRGASVIIESKLTWARNNGKVIRLPWEAITTIWASPATCLITSRRTTVSTQVACWLLDFPTVEGSLVLLPAIQHFPRASVLSQQIPEQSTPTRQAPAILHLFSQTLSHSRSARRVDPTSPCSSSMAMQTARSHILVDPGEVIVCQQYRIGSLIGLSEMDCRTRT